MKQEIIDSAKKRIKNRDNIRNTFFKIWFLATFTTIFFLSFLVGMSNEFYQQGFDDEKFAILLEDSFQESLEEKELEEHTFRHYLLFGVFNIAIAISMVGFNLGNALWFLHPLSFMFIILYMVWLFDWGFGLELYPDFLKLVWKKVRGNG